jgi:two-component system, NarL family, nitrate/nitrite response regulator NarL
LLSRGSALRSANRHSGAFHIADRVKPPVPIRVVTADPHPIVLSGLRAVLGAESDFKIVAECTDGEEVLHAVRGHRPDILVLDVRLPRKNGLEVVRQLKDEKLPTRVVFLVAALDDEELLETIRLDVGGIVLKGMSPRLLVQCLRKVHLGEPWIERTSAARAFQALLRREVGAREISRLLTSREIEIARMAVRGLRNKEIGDALRVSVGTVKTHLHKIYGKLDVESRAELIVRCHEKGIF